MLRHGCLLLLLVVLLLLRLGHNHALLVGLVALGDGAAGGTGDNLLVVLDESAACAPVGDTAVAGTVALDSVALPDLTTLDHGVTVVRRATLATNSRGKGGRRSPNWTLAKNEGEG